MHYAKTATPTDPRAGALADMRRAILALRPYLDTADQQADLFLIEEALTRLALPRAPIVTGITDFDPTRLGHLLEITGPDLGPELLARLIEDLIATEEGLSSGVRTADWKQLREASHVLISLSGSVGALSLQAMAESLNALAHRQDSDSLGALMLPLGKELGALIRLIRATQAPSRGLP